MAAAKDSECSDHKPFITVKSEDGTENTYYSILCEDLPEEMLQKARQEVNETEENKKEGLRKLKEYMQKEKMTDIDDDFAIAFLRCCKYDIKKSKMKLAKFMKIYDMTLNTLKKFGLDMVDAVMSEMGAGYFPYRDRKGRIIVFTRPFFQIFSYDMDFLVASFLAAAIFALTLPHASLLGVCIVFEGEVPEMRLYYPLMKCFIRAVPQAIHAPHRIVCVKVLNEHALVRLLYRIVRPFVPDKISKRVSFLGSGYGELHKDYPPEIMPQEYNGYLGPFNAEVYRQKILDRLKHELEKAKCS